jgi:hypothetical protein
MPEGHEDSNGGIGRDTQEAQKNSGGSIRVKGVDNPAVSKDD